MSGRVIFCSLTRRSPASHLPKNKKTYSIGKFGRVTPVLVHSNQKLVGAISGPQLIHCATFCRQFISRRARVTICR